MVGMPQTAFARDGSGTADTPAGTNAALFGRFFLTDTVDDTGGGSGVYLILDFDSPVSNASGYILDVDGGEQVSVIAYGDSAAVNQLEARYFTTNSPGTGDGMGMLWELNRATNDIRRIDIHGGGANIGYDLFSSNFSLTNPPAPHLGVRMYPGISIEGVQGRPYEIDYIDNVDSPGVTNWHALTNIFLPSTNYLWFDTSSPARGRFYRAVAVP